MDSRDPPLGGLIDFQSDISDVCAVVDHVHQGVLNGLGNMGCRGCVGVGMSRCLLWNRRVRPVGGRMGFKNVCCCQVHGEPNPSRATMHSFRSKHPAGASQWESQAHHHPGCRALRSFHGPCWVDVHRMGPAIEVIAPNAQVPQEAPEFGPRHATCDRPKSLKYPSNMFSGFRPRHTADPSTQQFHTISNKESANQPVLVKVRKWATWISHSPPPLHPLANVLFVLPGP